MSRGRCSWGLRLCFEFRVRGAWRYFEVEMTVHISDLPENVIADYEAATPRSERFASLRARILASGVPLLNDEELRAEIRERRGMLADSEL